MPNSDIFDRKEGYGHTAGTISAGKDDGNWGTMPTIPADSDESTNDRLFRSVDTKHGATPETLDVDYENNFIPADDVRYRRYVTFDMNDAGGDVERDDDGNAIGTYHGDNENRLDVESTEAAVYNRPVNAWDSDANATGEGIDLDTEHTGYRDNDDAFVVELDDPDDSTEASSSKPAVDDLYDVGAAAGGQPADDFVTVDDLDGNFAPA